MTTESPVTLGVTGLQELSPFPLSAKLGTGGEGSTNHSNLTTGELMLRILGPQTKDFSSSVLLTVVYSLVFLSGFIGNLCTCVVIAKNNYMQTTTNYYLFNLAVSDLMLIIFESCACAEKYPLAREWEVQSIGLPPELYSVWESYPWRFGEVFCIIRHTVMEMTSYASVLTITAFTVERYVAICRPLLAHKIASLSRAVKIIIVVWLVAVLAALPYGLHTRQFYAIINPDTNKPIPDSLVCNIPEEWRDVPMKYIFQVSTFVFFLTPVTIIICLYILIALALRKSFLSRGLSEESHYGSQNKHKNKNQSSNVPKQPRRVVMRILVAVAVAFIICWAPFHAQRLMVLYVPKWTVELMDVQSHLFYISGVLYFISSTVNPILYNVISKRYRLAFKETLCCCLNKSAQQTKDRKITSEISHKLQNGNHVSFSRAHTKHTDSNYQRVHLLDSPASPNLRKPILKNGPSIDSQTCDTPLMTPKTPLTADSTVSNIMYRYGEAELNGHIGNQVVNSGSATPV